jgi:hypothetical protein
LEVVVPIKFTVLSLTVLTDFQTRLMVAVWPLVKTCDPARKADVQRWARFALVPPSIAAQLAPRLIELGICIPGGTVPPEVTVFCAAAAAASVQAARPRARAKKS